MREESHDEISVINNLLSVVTLTSPPPSLSIPPIPTLPLDLVEEILCRLPVKLLCQLRCICKTWNSLITDPKFAKKHLSHSTTCHIHFLSRCTRHIYSSAPSYLLTSYPLDSFFTKVTSDVTQLMFSDSNYYSIWGSCNGNLCISDIRNGYILLCNPSLHKFKKLPPQTPQGFVPKSLIIAYGFGYDHVNDNYKVVIVLKYPICLRRTIKFKFEVKVYSLGTNCWKNIREFPFDGFPCQSSGKFVSGTINWVWHKNSRSPCFIVSFDLENESFQEVPKPDYGNVNENVGVVELSVLSDCLCMLVEHDIWLMKEYGNKESWTKLLTVSDPSKSYNLHKAIYIFEDGQVLFESCDKKLIVYDPRINTFEFTKLQNESVYDLRHRGTEVFVESLISL